MNRRIVIPEGATPPHEHDIDQSLHFAIAEAMGERKVRFTDRRLIIIFVFVVVSAVAGFLILKGQQDQLQHQQDQRDHDFAVLQLALLVNCQQQQAIVSKANAYFEAQIGTFEKRTDLKPDDKAALIRNAKLAEFPSLRCDLLPGG